jgi:hypothetical protein
MRPNSAFGAFRITIPPTNKTAVVAYWLMKTGETKSGFDRPHPSVG